MGTADKRRENRVSPSLRFNPVSAELYVNGESIPLEVVNYHFRGACFRVQKNDYRVTGKNAHLKFKIGLKEIQEKILFRIVWENVEGQGTFGVAFEAESSYVLARAERFSAHKINAPVVSAPDPLDPNRLLYFKAVNVSTTGMLLSTSLSNKHLFPGMELRRAVLDIAGMGTAEVELFIENSRASEEDKVVLYGVSVKSGLSDYISLISKYLSNMGGTENPDERLDKLFESKLIQKNLSRHLTIHEVTTSAEYEKVLKLRYLGYKAAGKVKDQLTWKDMGDGLDKEGVVIGAYLGGQLVASTEFRFQKNHGLTLSKKLDLRSLPGVRHDNLSEVNKLVVHPKAQSTDIVLGIFQKIHTIAMLNGKPDGIITAEDKLVPLYERLGFKNLNYSYAHPTKQNTSLNLMIIYSEAYSHSEGMNPYAWSMAFEETRNFFFEIGIQKERKLSTKQNIVKFLTKQALKILKKKKKPERSKDKEVSKKVSRNLAEPRWTRQHLNATIILPYILEAKDMVGPDWTTRALLDFGFDEAYFRSVSNWVSIEFFDEFLRKFSEINNAKELNRRAGYRSTSKEVLGANYFVVRHLLTPASTFKSFEKYMPKFNKTRLYKVLESTSTSCRIRITNPDPALLPKNISAKENWIALIDAYVRAATGSPAVIEIVKSSFDGDLYCEFFVRWKNPWFKTKNILLTVGFITLSSLGFVQLKHLFNPKEIFVLASSIGGAAFVIWLIFKVTNTKKKYQEIMESFSAYEKDADERYRELQNSKAILEISYQEGKLLESINREIQKSDDITNILQTASTAICEKFGFSRSFIMLVDESHKIMRTTAVHGGASNIGEVWEFKVDISLQRENPLVLSSVFHTGQSILVADIDEHKFQLNEVSRRLVEKLGTKSFAAVPIPSENKNWGVLVSDKGLSENLITRRDLVSLQRVAQSIGLALDKKAKIDTEANIRKIFQKFVPSVVVESTLGQKDASLGGESREAICLFMDIRNFTRLSAQVPPQILIEILNSVFQELHSAVSPSGGVIDKFLGDGALVTWGAIPGSRVDANAAISAAVNFWERITSLHSSLSEKGLAGIEVGMGIHRGPVIAGNIGANERMEFTVIGSTVNLASRLEQLTKVLNSHIVISESVVAFAKLSPDWIVHKEVIVRGVESSLNVASINLNSKISERNKSA